MNKFKKKKLKNIFLSASLIMMLGFLNVCFASSSVSAKNQEAVAPADNAEVDFSNTTYAMEDACQDNSSDFQSNEIVPNDISEPENIINQIKTSEDTENREPILSCCPDKYWLTRIDNPKNCDFENLTFNVAGNNTDLGEQNFIQGSFFVLLPKLPPPKGEDLATILKKE